MEMASCRVQLGDDNNNFKILKLVTPAEAMVLIAVHGGARVTQFIQHHPDNEDRAKRPLRDTRDVNGLDRPGEFERLRRKYNTKPNEEDWIVSKVFQPGAKLPMTFEEVGIKFSEIIRIAPVPNPIDPVITQADADLGPAPVEEPAPILNPVISEEIPPIGGDEASQPIGEVPKRGPGRPLKKQ